MGDYYPVVDYGPDMPMSMCHLLSPPEPRPWYSCFYPPGYRNDGDDRKWGHNDCYLVVTGLDGSYVPQK